ncbi:sigma-54-dependent Fis family transcriptional regulator [Cupriavidus necator]
MFGFNFSLERFVDKARAMRGSQFAAFLRDGRDVAMIVNVGVTGEAACSSRAPTDAGQSTDHQQTTPRSARVLLKDLDLGDPQMQRAIQKASMILGSDIPLLIEGESGVGKEVFTAAFHNSGPRHGGPFVAVNCAAIPEGLIESELFGYEEGAFTGAKRKGFPGKILQANGGTLFLDEIGDMPLSLQGRLLRVLQERQVTPLGSTRSMPVDVSIVCATHRSMIDEVKAGRFREDLYYRLNGLRIRLPSLRERKDISCLIDFVINAESGGRKIEVAPDVRHALCTHPWPGNIRQLQMTLRTALAILRDGAELRLEHLPDELLPTEGAEAPALAEAQPCDLAQIEMDAVRRAIAASDGNMSEAARILGISRKTLYRKLEKLSAQTTAGQSAKEQVAPGTKCT